MARPTLPKGPPPFAGVKRKIEPPLIAAPRPKVLRPNPAAPKPYVGKAAVAPPRPVPARVGAPLPSFRPPSKPPTPKSSVEAARRGEKSETNDNIKQTVKLRKVDVLSKQLLDEWSSLPAEKKEEGFAIIAAKFVERVPQEFLVTMAEQFAAAATPDGGRGSSGRLGGDEKEAAEDALDSAEAEEDAEVVDAELDAASFDAVREMLQKAETEPETEWSGAWSSLGLGSGDERGTVTALFEAAMQGSAGTEVAASLAVELVRSKTVEMKNVEHALVALARRLEEFVSAEADAWHLHGHALSLLFPKTPSTPWGFQLPGWSWTPWWFMAEKVLGAADNFRAFDILVMVLQTCQDKTEKAIKLQSVWKQDGRTAKVQQCLCRLGEMDGPAILETLAAYGVEL